MNKDDSCISSSLNLGGVEDTFVKYWDEAATVAVMEFKVDPVMYQQDTSTSGPKKEKEKKKKSCFSSFSDLNSML